MYLFRGGKLESDFFAGLFFSANPGNAEQYAGTGKVWAIKIDWENEVEKCEDDYGLDVSDFDKQAEAIELAVKEGATIVECGDGYCVINAARLNPVEITLDQAWELNEG